MTTRRKAIKVLEHDRRLMVKLYLKYRIPLDQFEARPAEWGAFTNEWNRLTGRKDTPQEVLHYMRNERKCSRWVKLGKNFEPSPPLPDMSCEEIEALVQIYEENVAILGNGSDTIAFDDQVKELLVKSFFEITGRGLPSHQLVQKLTALRKRGLLTKVSDMPQSDDLGEQEKRVS